MTDDEVTSFHLCKESFLKMAADEPSEVLLELSKIKQEISSGNSRRGEMVLDGLSKLDWGDLIIPGPYSVAVLGQLMALATSESANFGFKTIPLGGFKKIKWPKSFPACMVQLTDEAHSAFKTAHINIEEISLHAEYINNGIKNCLVLIFGESAAEIKKVV